MTAQSWSRCGDRWNPHVPSDNRLGVITCQRCGKRWSIAREITVDSWVPIQAGDSRLRRVA